MERIRIAIIGFGKQGQKYFYLLKQNPLFEVIGILDFVNTPLIKEGKNFKNKGEVLLSNPKAVLITTPHKQHFFTHIFS